MSNVTVDEVTTVGSVVNVKVYKYIYMTKSQHGMFTNLKNDNDDDNVK
jgi:hypothetical protein